MEFSCPHSLNNIVFGASAAEYHKKIKNDKTAQYRLANIIVEQAVFKYVEEAHLRNKVSINPAAPVSSIRLQIDEKSHNLGKKVLKILISSKKIAEMINRDKEGGENKGN